MSDDELYKKIRRIEIETNQLSQDLLAGVYRSAFKGRGMEFEEVREYQPGDDVRTIDWNVTARSLTPFVKNFREERELTVFLLVDVSASTRYGSKSSFKSDLIAEISACLSFSAIKNNDKIGLILFSDKIEKYIPPNKGSKHVLRIIREVLGVKPEAKGTNLEEAFSFLGKLEQKASIVFILSDFLAEENYEQELKLVSKKHDLIAIALNDSFEQVFPKLGFIHIASLESQESYFTDTNSLEFQQKFIDNAKEKKSRIKKLFQKNNAGFIELLNGEKYLPSLRKFFKLRARGAR